VFLTPKPTVGRTEAADSRGLADETEDKKVEFRTDEAQLLGLWAATRLLGEIRDLEDPMDRAELFTKAQILLTAFVLGLEPLNSGKIPSRTSGRWNRSRDLPLGGASSY
jgi:hypothetical protein